MADELLLLAAASDGTTEQWDGLSTEPGILLRWQAQLALGFPPRGYELFRAVHPDFRGILWDQEQGKMEAANAGGSHTYSFHGGEVQTHPEGASRSPPAPPKGTPVLQLDPHFPVTVDFPDAAWYLVLRPATTGSTGTTTVKLYSGGTLRDTAVMHNGGAPLPPWRTRGIERVVFSGDGAVGTVMYGLLHADRFWQRVGPRRICLPINDASYPCGTHPGTDEDEARKRVPAGVDFDARYKPEFGNYRAALLSLSGGSAPAPVAQGTAPSVTLGVAESVALACLDPHLARIAGLLLVDPVVLDGTEYAYRLRGLWEAPDWTVALRTSADVRRLTERGVTVPPRVRAFTTSHGLAFALGAAGWKIGFASPVDEVTLRLSNDAAATWTAFDGLGAPIKTGTWRKSVTAKARKIAAPGVEAIVVTGPTRLTLTEVAAKGVTLARETMLPSVLAKELGPPPGPRWVTAQLSQPGGAAGGVLADLEWDLARGGSARLESEPVLYQTAATTVPSGGAAPAFDRSHLLDDGTALLVPQPPPADGYYTEFDLPDGERHWWVRGVDLFGRVSSVSPPAVALVTDTAPPPPPELVLAEYVQRDLTPDQRALRAPSPPAAAWLAANPNTNGAVVVWAWTPELAALCPDVDGFRLYARRPQAGSGGAYAPDTTYDNAPWGAAIAATGAIATRFDGSVTAAAASGGQISVTAVTPIDATHAACTTNLSLDTGAGALVGARLAGAANYTIGANGQGANVTVTVTHPQGAPPATGTYTLERHQSRIAVVQTDLVVPAMGTDPHRRRIAGVLVSGERRFAVLGRSGADFLCAVPPNVSVPPAAAAVSWFPAYVVALEDTGFGPQASAAAPVAYAQFAVSAVRRASIEGPRSTPGTVAAVFATPPQPPILATIPTGEYCAKVATAADWFGVSRFTLTWTPQANEGYIVYRALWDAVWGADLAAHRVTTSSGTTVTPHAFPASALPTDAQRNAVAVADLAALEAAISGGQADAIAAAYAGLRADVQQLIAGQPAVEHAYIARNGLELRAGDVPYVDELDGRSRAHWFYRVAARSSSGVEGAKSPPTPPICAPDVVGPRPPRVHQALAASGAVKLRWTRSPDADVVRYLLFRAREETAARDVRDMTLVARIAPAPTATAAPGEVLPTDVPPWLGYDDPAPAGEWLYRLVAVDADGNRSLQSDLLRGRALLPPPIPPTWVAATRQGPLVQLSWSHPQPRLACQVERRAATGGRWTPLTEWLPRGVYLHDDEPPDVAAGWDYRLRVRDQLNQPAPSIPSTTLPPL
jgi:hypothetical protein